MTPTSPPLIDHVSPLVPRYDAILSDVWGVIHNGLTAFTQACEALARARGAGLAVVLVSNAPRPRSVVMRHLASLGVPRETYDDVITSGDVAQTYIAARAGEQVFHIGPERDLANFDGFDVRLGPLESADYVVCTGLFDDDVETPDDYRELLAAVRRRNLFMVCANPDLVVERGARLVYCAGALADLYAQEGGEVLFTGKPHRPIYEQARDKIAAVLGHAPPLRRILAIGNSVRTDLAGATALGVDCLFVSGGIHAEEIGAQAPEMAPGMAPGMTPDMAALGAIFAQAERWPVAITPRLRW